MRTNIVLDDDLIGRAFKFVPAKTKKEVVNLALKEFVENHARLNLLEIKGKVSISKNYDYKRMRKNGMSNGSR